MLLMEALNSQEFLLSGEPTRRVLKHNTQAFDCEVYYTIGKMVAVSIIHGGPAPTFLQTQSLITFLVKRDNLKYHMKTFLIWRFDRKLKRLGRLCYCILFHAMNVNSY